MDYELFFHFIAGFIIIKSLGCFIFPRFANTNFIKSKDRRFILIRFFGTTTENTWNLFGLSILWFLVYFKNYFI